MLLQVARKVEGMCCLCMNWEFELRQSRFPWAATIGSQMCQKRSPPTAAATFDPKLKKYARQLTREFISKNPDHVPSLHKRHLLRHIRKSDGITYGFCLTPQMIVWLEHARAMGIMDFFRFQWVMGSPAVSFVCRSIPTLA